MTPSPVIEASAELSDARLDEHTGYFRWLCEKSKHPMHHDVLAICVELIALRAALREADGTLEACQVMCAEWRGIYSGQHPSIKWRADLGALRLAATASDPRTMEGE